MARPILVTGVNGLVGSAVIEALAGKGVEIVGVDQGVCANGHLARYRFEAVDLTSPSLGGWLQQCAPRAIIHLAAMTAVDLCEVEREKAWRINVDTAATIARYAAFEAVRLVHVSTDYVFDGCFGAPYGEESAAHPLGVYAKTKYAGELAVEALCPQAVIARTSVPFGPYRHVKKDFVAWLRRELENGRDVRIVTDQLSNPTYAPHLGEILVALTESGQHGLVHTVGQTGLSRFAFAELVCDVFSFDKSKLHPIETAELKQAAPRPLDARMRVDRLLEWGFDPLPIRSALERLRRDGAR